MTRLLAFIVAAASGWTFLTCTWAQGDEPAATKPATTTKSAAQQARDQLRARRRANPLIEPTVRPDGTAPKPPQTGISDPAVLGVAPDAKAPPLRREGEFVITRRGRLIKAPDAVQVLFQFEADSADASEPPMIMLPCRQLEHMENMLENRGSQSVLIVTGQVFVYRGANYLLPTVFTLPFDKGNL